MDRRRSDRRVPRGSGRAPPLPAQRPGDRLVDAHAAHFNLLMEMARHGDIRPVIAATHPLEDAATAQESLAGREHVGKIVLRP